MNCPAGNMHLGKGTVVTQLNTALKCWVKILNKGGQVDTFILDFEKAFDIPLKNYIKAYMYMELVERHPDG